jgi:branched-chain amino acid transport system substrate-binding protein
VTSRLSWVYGVGFLLGAACSLTRATGFTECTQDTDCSWSAMCSEGYCLPLPAACERSEGDFGSANRILFGAVLPLRDSASSPRGHSQEVHRRNALRLAITMANARDGLKQRHFALVVCDSEGRPEQTAELVRWLAINMHVPAVVTSGNEETLAAAAETLALDAGTVIVSPNATTNLLLQSFTETQSVWRLAAPDALEAKLLSKKIRAAVPGTSPPLSVIFEKTEYGLDFAKRLADDLASSQFVVTRIDFDLIDTKALSPDDARNAIRTQMVGPANKAYINPKRATVVVASPEYVRELMFVANAQHPEFQRDAGHQWFLNSLAVDPSIFSAGNRSLLEEQLGLSPAHTAGPAFASFAADFRSAYDGIDPSTIPFAAHAYDTMWTLMLSAAWAARDSQPITGSRMNEGFSHLTVTGAPSMDYRPEKWIDASRALLAGSNVNVQGASGLLDFDTVMGAPSAPFEVLRVTDGGFVREAVEEP